MPQSIKSEERKMNNPDRSMSHSTGFRLFIIITLLLSCLTLSSCKLINLRPSVGNDDSAIGGTTDDESSDVTDGENTVGGDSAEIGGEAIDDKTSADTPDTETEEEAKPGVDGDVNADAGADGDNGVDDDTKPGAGDVSDGDTTVDNDITVNPSPDSVEYAATMGLRSAVSVYCAHTVTTGGSSPWNPNPSTQTKHSAGAGVIYKVFDGGDAFIITNFHVTYSSESDAADGISQEIYVYLYGMEASDYAIPATYVGGSLKYDIAVLRVEDSEILDAAVRSGSAAAVTVGDSNAITPGMTTVAVGNPASATTTLAGISVTRGIVSVDSEYITMSAVDGSGDVSFRVIRTDTAINSGNSGGGLYNIRGELIGIVNAKLNSSTYEDIGYAIPTAVARAVADNIIDNCFGKDCRSVMRALIGVGVSVQSMYTVYNPVTATIRRVEVVAVGDVLADGLAFGVIEVGDVMKSITVGGRTFEITRTYNVIDAMLDARGGDSVTVTVERDGVELSFDFTIPADSLVAS